MKYILYLKYYKDNINYPYRYISSINKLTNTHTSSISMKKAKIMNLSNSRKLKKMLSIDIMILT